MVLLDLKHYSDLPLHPLLATATATKRQFHRLEVQKLLTPRLLLLYYCHIPVTSLVTL